MHTVAGSGKVTGGFWWAAAVAALAWSSGGCSGGAAGPELFDAAPTPTTDLPVAPTDGPAMTGETAEDAGPGPVSAAPTGPPAKLVLDTVTPMDPGSHCGRTAVYFEAARISSYALDISAGGAIHAASDTLNSINASVYCTFSLPDGTNSLVFHRGIANVKIDPTTMFPAASGGGLGFLIYFGAERPGEVKWGDYGKSVLSHWKETRPDWNRDLPAEDATVAVPAGTTIATFAVYLVDAWGNIPVTGDVASTSVEARSASLATDAGTGP